jgi:hypothetical protein
MIKCRGRAWRTRRGRRTANGTARHTSTANPYCWRGTEDSPFELSAGFVEVLLSEDTASESALKPRFRFPVLTR